jgi:acylphosphatase
VELRIAGYVQGVFFRDELRRRASSRRVAGWVSNEPDGTVSAVLEGPPDAVEALVEWCRRGPRGASVERLERRDAEPRGEQGFVVS